MSTFNPNTDPIAFVVKEFTLKKSSEFFLDRYSEPYIVSLAIDQDGANNPAIDFNILPFPRVKKGDKITFGGQGHLIYGPKNPGDFLAYTILFMESDRDVQDFGVLLQDIITAEATNMGAQALLVAAPGYGTAISILQSLTEFLAIQLQKNKDDELFRRNGTLLRAVVPAYDILRTYQSGNDYIKVKTEVIPLSSSNMLGSQIQKLTI